MARLKIGVIPIEGGHYYREALEEVTHAEELGFESVWMEEHHAVTDHYWPSPLTVLAGFATRTSRVTLGTDILVAAFYHPVRLAEDVALLDVRSEEHTSELQSQSNLVCRLLLEKKKNNPRVRCHDTNGQGRSPHEVHAA